MPIESSVKQRVHMFESGTPQKNGGHLERAKALSKHSTAMRRTDCKGDPPQTVAPSSHLVGAQNSIEWPSDDDRDIPAPTKENVDSRDAPLERQLVDPLQNRSAVHRSQRPMPKSRVEEKPVSKDNFDENTNPARAVLDWPCEEPQEHANPVNATSRKTTNSRESTRTTRLRKMCVEPRRQKSVSPRAQRVDNPAPSIRSSNSSHLNDALKRSLNDASTVLQEERASSVATSSSSLSSDELTNIAKRAIRASQMASARKKLEDDDVTIGSVSTTRSARYSAARQRMLNRKRNEEDDTTSISSIKSSKSQHQFQSRALALAARAHQRRRIVDDKTACSDDVSTNTPDLRPTPPLPTVNARAATPSHMEADLSRKKASSKDEVIVAPKQDLSLKGTETKPHGPNDEKTYGDSDSFPRRNSNNYHRQSQGRDYSPKTETPSRSRRAVQLSGRRQSPAKDKDPKFSNESDVLDDASVASQSSNHSRREIRRKAFLAAAERKRSISPQVRYPANLSATNEVQERYPSAEKDSSDDVSVASISSNPSRRALSHRSVSVEVERSKFIRQRDSSDCKGSPQPNTRQKVETDTLEDSLTVSRPSKASGRILQTRILAMAKNRSSSPQLSPSQQHRHQTLRDDADLVASTVSRSQVAYDSKIKTTDPRASEPRRPREVIDVNANATDEGIPKVRSMNVEASGSNLSETTQRVKNTSERDRPSSGVKPGPPSRVTTHANSGAKDAPATFSVSKERARLIRNKALLQHSSSRDNGSPVATRDRRVLEKTTTRHSNGKECKSPPLTLGQQPLRDSLMKQINENPSKSSKVVNTTSANTRPADEEQTSERSPQLSESEVNPSDDPVYTRNASSVQRISPNTNLEQTRYHDSRTNSHFPNKTREYASASPVTNKASMQREAFEQPHSNENSAVVSGGSTKFNDQGKDTALQTQSNSPRAEKRTAHPIIPSSGQLMRSSQSATDALIEDVENFGNHIMNTEHPTIDNAAVMTPAKNKDSDAAIVGLTYNGCDDVTSLGICSAQKPLASNNPYIAHLQQKVTCANLPISSPIVRHGANMISPSPVHDTLQPRDSAPVKEGIEQGQHSRKDESSDEASSDHDLFSLMKASEDSMLAYSESEAGSAFANIKNGKGGLKAPDTLSQNRSRFVKKSDDLSKGPIPEDQTLGETMSRDKVPVNKKIKSSDFAQGITVETGLQLSAALQWWQKNYAQNQDESMNKLVQDALAQSPHREMSRAKLTKQLDEPQHATASAGAADSHSFTTDEGSIFSGLEDNTKSKSCSADGEEIKCEEGIPQSQTGGNLFPSHGTESVNRIEKSVKIKIPPPPPQKHLGDIVDACEVVNTVNSDITSSVVAGDSQREAARTVFSSFMIKEELSGDIEAENDTDRSDVCGKSRSSRRTTTTGASDHDGKSKMSQKTMQTDYSDRGGDLRSTSTSAFGSIVDKPSNTAQVKRKGFSPGRSRESKRESGESEGGDFDVNDDTPLFQCGDGYRQVEEKQSILKAVFLKFGHSILDRFETACRGPEIPFAPGSPGSNGVDSTKLTAFADQISETHSLAESIMSAMNSAETRKWDEWDRRDSQSASAFITDTNTETSLDVSHFTDRLTIADTSQFAEVSERQTEAHKKLMKYTQAAMSDTFQDSSTKDSDSRGYTTATSPSGTSAYDTSAVGTSAFGTSVNDSSSAGTSYFDIDSKLSLEKPKLLITTDITSPPNSGTTSAPTDVMSLNQRRILKNFFSTLKKQGIEVLKQNRDAKWQIRYLTVSKELKKLKHVNLGEKEGGNGEYPIAILWVKRFVSRSVYSSALIDKQGRGGFLLSHLVKVTAMARSDSTVQLPKKFQEKFKDSVIVVLEYSLAGSTRSMAMRCKNTTDAHFLCTGLRVCIDACKREKDGGGTKGIEKTK